MLELEAQGALPMERRSHPAYAGICASRIDSWQVY
jgi:hypothetical protein